MTAAKYFLKIANSPLTDECACHTSLIFLISIAAWYGDNWSSHVWGHHKTSIVLDYIPLFISFGENNINRASFNFFFVLQAKFFINILAEPPEVVRT